MAYLLLSIETTLRNGGVYTSWVPADAGELRIRRSSTPERVHREIYTKLGVRAEVIPARKLVKASGK